MTFAQLAAERYSVRKFDPRPVEQEKLDAILEAGRLSPTARNNQPQRVYVLRSADALAKINTCSPFIYGAPVVFAVCCNMDEVWHNSAQKGYDSSEVDCAIVTTQLMYAAWELGIGSCWVRRFNADEVREKLGLPANVKPVALLPAGYAAEGCVPGPWHGARRPLEETTQYL